MELHDGGTASKHPPSHAGHGAHNATSPWFALRYVHEYLAKYSVGPDLSPHSIVKLVATMGAETNGRYDYSVVVRDTQQYADHHKINDVGTGWVKYVGHVIQAGTHHNKREWVRGFAYSSKDIPGTGGPSTIQKIADGPVGNAVVSAGHVVQGVGSGIGGLGSLFSNPMVLLVAVVLVVVLVAKK